MQKFLCAASRESSNLKGEGMSLGDGRPAVILTFWMRSSGQIGFGVVFEIMVGQLP